MDLITLGKKTFIITANCNGWSFTRIPSGDDRSCSKITWINKTWFQFTSWVRVPQAAGAHSVVWYLTKYWNLFSHLNWTIRGWIDAHSELDLSATFSSEKSWSWLGGFSLGKWYISSHDKSSVDLESVCNIKLTLSHFSHLFTILAVNLQVLLWCEGKPTNYRLVMTCTEKRTRSATMAGQI